MNEWDAWLQRLESIDHELASRLGTAESALWAQLREQHFADIPSESAGAGHRVRLSAALARGELLIGEASRLRAEARQHAEELYRSRALHQALQAGCEW
jgi:hypothetical protein